MFETIEGGSSFELQTGKTIKRETLSGVSERVIKNEPALEFSIIRGSLERIETVSYGSTHNLFDQIRYSLPDLLLVNC